MSIGLRPGAPLERLARAKINLYLRIVGRRDDGYHLLQSLVVFADLADRLRVAPASGLTLEISGPFAAQCGAGEDNLVLRAARSLADFTGRRAGASFRLEKNIPVAAGLGGGSADAAAALLLLGDLWGVALAPGDLNNLASRLGADVPACLHGRACLVEGVGERLRQAPPLPAAGIVVANPRQSLATARVFAALTPPFQPIVSDPPASANLSQLVEEIARRGNGLTAAARQLCPAIGEVLGALTGLAGVRFAQMSGSGASCFALFEDVARANQAAATMRRRQPAWFVHAGALIG